MTYSEVILNLSNSILLKFDEVHHSVEIFTNDEGKKLPVLSSDYDTVLAPTDQREIIYIRRNGDDEVLEEAKISSCGKAYKMRSSLRIVFFKDHAKQHGKILSELMQSVLISGTKLKAVIRDKFKLLKDESSGSYNFGANTAYFAIDIYALWNLAPSDCYEDFCADIINPLTKESCVNYT